MILDFINPEYIVFEIILEIRVKSNLQAHILIVILYQWRMIYTNGVGIIFILQLVKNYTIILFLPL